MRQLIKLLLLTFVWVSSLNSLMAVPAYPGIIQKTQSDGTTLNYYLFGDEYFSWARTTDGYTIKHNTVGDYVYMIKDIDGDLVLSEVIAHDPESRSDAELLFLSTLETEMFYSKEQMAIVQQAIAIRKAEDEKASRAFPTTGNRKLICILIGFQDRAFVKTQAEFSALFNEIGYSTGGATGSVKDYYLESSYNQFNLTVDVAGPYVASRNMAYYGSNTSGNPSALVREAINLADPHVNFAEYDNDNDGYVDAVYIIFAGYGEEAGGPADAIWSHASSLYPAVYKDGKYISRYSCSPELRGSYGQNITNIGVICHEFGHVLGAPDYYDTNYETGGQFSGTGDWDMMAGGSWNNNGATPAHHNGYTKTKIYNWAPAVVLNQPASITIEHAAYSTTSFYQINTTTTNEYFLIENRQKQGFDAYIPGHGMIIYHVHSNMSGNNINATHPQRMYPVCASATMDPTSNPSSYGNINSQGCAWPYSEKTSFTDQTLPSSKSWAGNNTNKPITNITRDYIEKTVSFDFMGGEGNPTIFEATALNGSEIQLVWDHTTVNYMVLAYSPTGVFGTPANGTNYTVGSTIPGGGVVLYAGTNTSFIHQNLNASTAHYYKIWARKNNVPEYSRGKKAFAYTDCNKVNRFPFVENFGSKSCPPCFTIVDSIGNSKVWLFDNPRNRPFESTTGANGFAILDSEYYGSESSQNSQMITGLFDFSEYETVNVSFEHFYRHRNSTARFFYSTDGGETYQQIAAYTSTVGSFSSPATASFNLSSQLSGQSNVRFKWSYTADFGIYWCIDDFTITAQDRKAMSIKHLNITYENGGKVVDYATVNVGSSKNYSFYIHSIGDLPLTVSNPTVNSSKYTITTNPASTIQPGDSSLFVVKYQPTSAGTDTVVVTINNNTPINNPYRFTLKSNVANQFNATFTINDGLDPVEGVLIALTGYGSQTTNSNGQTTFNNVQAGVDISFTASKTGHITTTGTIKLIDANTNFTVTVPRTDVDITFHLKNETGGNVMNARVSVEGYGQQTTSGGKATFTLPPLTNVDFTCSATNYVTYTGTINTGTTDRTEVIVMERVTYTVTVNVNSTTGEPIEGALVILGSYPDYYTNAEGVAVITGVLPTNSINLWVGKEGCDTHTSTIKVTGDCTIDVSLVGIENDVFGEIQIFPIPTSGVLQINNIGVPANYNLVDISGRVLLSGTLQTGDNLINLGQLNSGIYHITLISDKMQKTYKIVKQ